MNKFAREMAFYSAYHQESTNIWIHVLGVPLITFTAFVPLSWLSLFDVGDLSVTAAMVVYAATMVYYLSLDLAMGLVAVLLYGTLLGAAHSVSALGYSLGIGVFLAGQLGGWGVQIWGHVHFERNRPAFLESLFHSLVSAPLFVIADVFFHLGLKKTLENDVHQILADTGRLRQV